MCNQLDQVPTLECLQNLLLSLTDLNRDSIYNIVTKLDIFTKFENLFERNSQLEKSTITIAL